MATPGLYGRKPPLPRDVAPRVIVDDYVDFAYRATLPKPTPAVTYTVPTWPMYLNDQLGDCTEAAKGHAIQALSMYGQGQELTLPNSQIKRWYERDGGYVPGDPSTDNGCVMQTVLQNWQANDSAIFPISEFGELKDYYTASNLKEALYLFGTVYVGINAPQSMEDQFSADEPFTYVPGSPILGGHCIVLQDVLAPGANDMLGVVTWGKLVQASREWWNHYVEEAWVVISPDWFNSAGVDPDGFNLAQLQADFASLA